jgi:hypothetical protein
MPLPPCGYESSINQFEDYDDSILFNAPTACQIEFRGNRIAKERRWLRKGSVAGSVISTGGGKSHRPGNRDFSLSLEITA